MEKRSLGNVVLTKKYHRLYMGRLVMICLAPIALVYAVLLSQLFSLSYPNPPRTDAIALLFAFCIALAAAVWAAAVLTAHRIAGPNIKLVEVCRAIADGDTDLRLKFRAKDGLEELEDAFNGMVVALKTGATRLERESDPRSE